jgi:hypothetical protein
MSVFWQSTTFNKQYNDQVFFRISAFNVNGWSIASNPNTVGATVYTVPQSMNPPTRNSKTSSFGLVVDWAALTNTDALGGQPLLSYGLQWD